MKGQQVRLEYLYLNNETIVGFEVDGAPITQKQLLEDVEEVQQQLEAGTLKTYSSDEVRRRFRDLTT